MFHIFSGFSLSSTLNSSRIEILTIYRKFIQNSLKIIKISELTLQQTKKLRIYSFTVISHEIDTFEPLPRSSFTFARVQRLRFFLAWGIP